MRAFNVRIWTLRFVGAAILAATLLGLACAGTGDSAPGGVEPRPADPAARARARAASGIYRSAEDAFEAGDYVTADSLAVDVIVNFTDTEWLGPALLLSARSAVELDQREEARTRLARYLTLYRYSDRRRVPGLILVATLLQLEGAYVEAADSLLATPLELGDDREWAARVTRQVASQLGLGDIEALAERWPSDHPLRSVFAVERASLLMAAGQMERGRELARQVLGLDPLGPERERARNIESGEVETEQWRPIIGAILPLSGPLAAYGRMAEEGIRLAVEEYNRRYLDAVTLIIRDDGDDIERDGELARELDRLGAVAIIGPLRSEGLEAAARARRDRDLLIVSPTAPENFSFRRNVYTLWSTTERVTRGARTLATFAVRDLRVFRFGVMYPDNLEGRTQLAAFADAVRARGGEITGTIAYVDTATTFEVPITYLARGRPQAIYAPASTSRGVIQLAPQFSFYGMRGVQVLGDAEWSAPEVLRQVEPRFINGTVVSTFLYRESASVRWSEFVEAYERTYRKGLQESLVPALAYDAAHVILSALPWGFPRRSAIARAFRETRDLPGATGVFSVRRGTVTRRPFLLHVKDRQLVPAFEELRSQRTN